jgi:hypothetical protein
MQGKLCTFSAKRKNHACLAQRINHDPDDLCQTFFQANMAACSNPVVGGHPGAWTADGDCHFADYGIEGRKALSEFSSSAQLSRLVEPGSQPSAAGSYSMGEEGLGIALPDGAGSFGTLLRKAQMSSQGADRLGQTGAFASQTLAAGPKTDRGDGWRLCRHRFPGSSGQTGLSNHLDRPFPTGFGLVCAGTKTEIRKERPAAQEGPTPAGLEASLARPADSVEESRSSKLVRRRKTRS